MGKSKRKKLIINDILYAEYEIKNEILFLKIREPIMENDIGESEEVCHAIITIIEKQEFKGTAYLNI